MQNDLPFDIREFPHLATCARLPHGELSVPFMGIATQDELLVSMQEHGINPDLVRAALANVGMDKLTYLLLERVPTEAVLLVSGLLLFVKNWNQKFSNPTLVLCDKHVHNKRTKYRSTLR
jgi:hypothetical protein